MLILSIDYYFIILQIQSAELELEKNVFMYRAYIALKKYKFVLDEINDSSPEELKVLKLLAEYFSNPNCKEEIIDKIQKKSIESSTLPKTHTFMIVAGTIFYNQNDLESALKVIHKSINLECMTLRVQIYLKMSRIDLATKEIKTMQEIDDDATLTQLALAWVNLATGRNKYQEAFYIFEVYNINNNLNFY